MEQIITREYLKANPAHIFVFGDNILHQGYGGAAVLRDEPNACGFITKRYPDTLPSSSYTSKEYRDVYKREIKLLKAEIEMHPTDTFLISKLGAGLANRFGIFESIIEPNIKKDLEKYNNVKFLW